jgi:hypothetical protein
MMMNQNRLPHANALAIDLFAVHLSHACQVVYMTETMAFNKSN